MSTPDPIALNKLAGSRRAGYTSEDVLSTCAQLNSLLGYDWVVVWDFQDMWGTGGSSESFLRDPQTQVIYEEPGFLTALLFDGRETTLTELEAELAELVPAIAPGLDSPLEDLRLDHANYAQLVLEGEHSVA